VERKQEIDREDVVAQCRPGVLTDGSAGPVWNQVCSAGLRD